MADLFEPERFKKFEDGMAHLEGLIEKLESGELELDEAISIFEEACKVAKWCYGKLNEAEKKIKLLLKDENGVLTLKESEIKGE